MNKQLITYQLDAFFCFRTPLLPLEAFRSWSEGLEGSGASSDPESLKCALVRDKALLRSRLADLVARPEIREALLVASPDLVASLPRWLANPESEKGQRTELALVRYFARMCHRSTPFGLFAGHSTGGRGQVTILELGRRSSYQRRTRLDMGWLCSLTDQLQRDREFQLLLTYRPNNSLYRCGGRLRYALASTTEGERSHHLAAILEDGPLADTLCRASQGARLGQLALALTDDDTTYPEALDYLLELAREQVLVPELEPCSTGPEPLPELIRILQDLPTAGLAVEALRRAERILTDLDGQGLASGGEPYHQLEQVLGILPGLASRTSLWQVDLFKPTISASLGPKFCEDALAGVNLLQRVTHDDGYDPFKVFRESFRARYEYRWVPLTAVLDPEFGLGFSDPDQEQTPVGPLLKGLFPGPPDTYKGKTGRTYSTRDIHLIKRVTELKVQGKVQLELTESDLLALEEGRRQLAFPNSFILILELATRSAETLASGEYQALLLGGLGPSAARMLGRFCHGDPDLLSGLKAHLKGEEALHPGAVFAEIAHLPSGRMGNVLARPVLRSYEIPFLGRSGAPSAEWIPLEDLYVGLVGDKVVLWSRKLDREVIPRLSSAANYHRRPTGMYRFLASLQDQGVHGFFGFRWGALDGEPHLPRVVHGKFILARAQWRLGKEGMVVLASSKTPEARFMAWQKLRGQGGWPRHMLLSDGDNELPFDLENTMSLDALWGVIKSWKDAVLLEDFPGTESRAIHGPEGAYAGQLMLPYLASMEAEPTLHSPILEGDPVRYGPGSDWLFVKLYTGRASADQILAGPLNELVKEVIASKEVDRWFFIRYSDPEPHLRVRFHGDAYTLCHAVLPRVHRLLDPLAQDGWFSGIQLDSYEPELSRYGGFNNLETIEAIFHADSEAVLKILAVIPADEGPLDTRWPLGLISVDQWLAAAGLALSERLTFVRNLHAGFSSPPGLEQASLKKHLGKRFREERTRLESLFSGASSLPRTWAMGREILLERTRQTTPMFDAMRRLLEVGDLTLSLEEVLGSIVHMGLNRLLRATNSQQEEPVIHYFLGQLYASQLARGGMLPRP